MRESHALMMEIRGKAVSTLRDILKSGREWEKVHAAEALLENGYSEGVTEVFEAELGRAGPPFRIGVWRVLAKSQGNDLKAADGYIDRIRETFLSREAPDRAHALESLAKLRVVEQSEEVLRLAQEGP